MYPAKCGKDSWLVLAKKEKGMTCCDTFSQVKSFAAKDPTSSRVGDA